MTLLAPIPERDGVPVPASDGRAMDTELRLLEPRHRSKNMLAIVTALVNQTLRGSLSLEEAREVLTARLVAMGSALDLLVDEKGEAASLPELVERALTQFGGCRERIALSGPDILIGPTTALHLALAIHELETNAIKYGALSDQTGRVSIRWELSMDAEPKVTIWWNERDGPPVSEPGRKGFGSRMISQIIARRLNGRAEHRFYKEGFGWMLEAPLSTILL